MFAIAVFFFLVGLGTGERFWFVLALIFWALDD